MPEERRRFKRAPLVCRVVLEDENGERSEGRSIDVSVHGMQIKLKNYEHLSSPVKFQAFVGEGKPSFTIEGEAEITRKTEDGHMGLHLLKIDVDGLTHLRRLVRLNPEGSKEVAEDPINW